MARVKAKDDRTCLQAPDDSAAGKDEDKKEKEKKAFIEPDLRAFMDRNIPKLKVFLNITDMKEWKKKYNVNTFNPEKCGR